MNRIRPRLLALAASAVLVLPATSALAEHGTHSPSASADGPPTVAAVDAVLRDLWIGHVFWVRNVVTAALGGDRLAAEVSEAEVVANARAIAAAIQPYYGEEAADQLFTLLAGHYGAVKKIIDAAAAGKDTKQDAQFVALNGNASQIAKFLSAANPNLPFDTLNGLLLAHGAHHVQQIDELREKRFRDEAKTWAAMKDHMYVIADALAAALAKQFPDKFR